MPNNVLGKVYNNLTGTKVVCEDYGTFSTGYNHYIRILKDPVQMCSETLSSTYISQVFIWHALK
jgi:hypothetical protein